MKNDFTIIDTHAHLHVKEFDEDRSDVIKRARDSGVDFISVGFEREGNRKAAALAEEWNTWWTAGIHPHHADQATPAALAEIEALAGEGYGKGMVAIGECGLDYFKNFQPRTVQLEAFSAQLKLANKMKLPLIVHCREATADALQLMDREKIERAVFHCFTGTREEAQNIWDRGFLTSFTGICTYPSAQNLREIIAKAPEDKIMIESDCPFLAPQSQRGMRNEPAFLGEVAQIMAQMREMEGSSMRELLLNNTRSFFSLGGG